MNDNFIDREISDEEFEKWLSTQLKDNLLSPPEEFTSKVVAKLEKPTKNGQIDPSMLIVLIVILMINGILLAFPYFLNDDLTNRISRFFLLETQNQLSSASNVIIAVVMIGLLFVGLDFLLSKRFGGFKVSVN